MLEKRLEEQARQWAMKRRWIVIKFTPRGEKGWMDRIFINRYGTHVWIEFKKPGEEPEPIQYFRMKLLKRQNCHVHWFDNLEDVKQCLNHYELLGEQHESHFPCCSFNIDGRHCECSSFVSEQ